MFLAQVTEATTWLNAASNWGLGIALAVFVVLMFRSFLNKVMCNVEKREEGYQKLLQEQNTLMGNHMDHLTAAVEQGNKELSVEHATQQATLELGFQNVVQAVNAQTEILKKKD